MLNRKNICLSEYHYAHRAYIEMLLNFGANTKKGELMVAFWYKDTPNHFDTPGPANIALQRAAAFCGSLCHSANGSRACWFIHTRSFYDWWCVHACKTHKITVHVYVYRAAANIEEALPPNYKIKLEEIVLCIRKVTPPNTCHLAIISTMKLSPVKYPIRHVEMCSFSVTAGVTAIKQETNKR